MVTEIHLLQHKIECKKDITCTMELENSAFHWNSVLIPNISLKKKST